MGSRSNNSMKPRDVLFSEGSKKMSVNENRTDYTKCDWSYDSEGNGKRLLKNDNSFVKYRKLLRGESPGIHSVQQAAIFPSYNYSSRDHLFVESRDDLSTMSTYNMTATVNTPWTVNSFDGMALNQHNVTVSQNQPPITMAAGLEMVQSSSSNMNPHTFMGIQGDNVYGVVGMGNYCSYDGVPAENIFPLPVKEVVHLTNCVLYPPNPNVPCPTTRERPLCCKTVFVGGLPEKITEEMLKEIFERCGTVETIRMSGKDFCHIRFSDELFVERALYFSGYKLRIENKNEVPFAGQLHVDYFEARDDQYDYEFKQRAVKCQAPHQDPDNSNKPPALPVRDYTDHGASLICEKLKNEETFMQAASILITWLEKGECTKKTASSFFSIIQSTHNYVRKLQLDKVKYEDQLNEAKLIFKKQLKDYEGQLNEAEIMFRKQLEGITDQLNEAKMMFRKQLEGIIRQFTEIEKIYKAASLQKCWDQFTKAQRKKVETWKNQLEVLKDSHLKEVINEREDEEMDLSDNENYESKSNAETEKLKKQFEEDVHKLREDNYSLKCQLEAAHNEIMDYKKELKMKDNQIAMMSQILQNEEKEFNFSEKCSNEAYSTEKALF